MCNSLFLDFVLILFFTTGSSFFVPVAGFICRLCNKFYHFESSALHTHCKSLNHFEKLKVGLLTSLTCFHYQIGGVGQLANIIHIFDHLFSAFQRFMCFVLLIE